MSKQRKYAQDPVLYIAQPEFKTVSASMQSHYHTPKKSKGKPKKSENETSLKEKELRRGKSSTSSEKKASKSVDDKEEEFTEDSKDHKQETSPVEDKQEEQEQESKSHNKRQRFGDMSIEEKVNYFVSLPKQVPKMKCEVSTENETHRGLIIDYKDKIVHMKTIRRPYNAKMNIDDIQQIRLLGF